MPSQSSGPFHSSPYPPSSSSSALPAPSSHPARPVDEPSDSTPARNSISSSLILLPATAQPRSSISNSIDLSAIVSSSNSVGQSSGAAEVQSIEMEPIVGHRRRRSTLLGPTNPTPPDPASRTTHSRAHSLSLGEEPKIEEEGGVSSKESGARDSFSDEDLHDDEEAGLTDKERRRKQKKKRRNTQLDQRVAKDRKPRDGQKPEKTVARKLLVNVVLIGLWYAFSLSISLYNKWMFDHDRLNFAFPLFTTSMHMLVQFGLAAIVLWSVPSLRPHYSSDQGRSRHETEPLSAGMSKLFYLTRIAPCGASTGLDIGLGNTSLQFISLTFYTMCKSSSLAFVLIFAFVFRLETPTWRLVTIIATMTLGVVLMVFGEIQFDLGGFFLVISAAFFSGLRWALTQILLLRNASTSNPFSSIFYLTPVMFATLFILGIFVEKFGPLLEGLKVLSNEWGAVLTPVFLLFPGCIAFAMTACEFALLQRTSVVTLSIAGIFKEVVTISAASVVFEDKLTPVNFVGLIVTLCAILAYNYIKIAKMRREAQDKTQGNDDDAATAFVPSSTSASDAENADDEEETAGLLHNSQTLVTSDGDFQPSMVPSPSRTSSRQAGF